MNTRIWRLKYSSHEKMIREWLVCNWILNISVFLCFFCRTNRFPVKSEKPFFHIPPKPFDQICQRWEDLLCTWDRQIECRNPRDSIFNRLRDIYGNRYFQLISCGPFLLIFYSFGTKYTMNEWMTYIWNEKCSQEVLIVGHGFCQFGHDCQYNMSEVSP